MYKDNFLIIWVVVVGLTVVMFEADAQSKAADFTLRFKNTANGNSLVLLDSTYKNTFGESYQVTKLKYYISNIHLTGKQSNYKSKEVFLLNAAGSDSATFQLKPGIYTELRFMLGVDSILNCSGAQDGALDPLNGMFWTWNSGYVYFKMEGYSTSSTADLQRIEHHIGGYRGINKADRQIELTLKEPIVIKDGDTKAIFIQVDLDKYWQGKSDIKIAENALIMFPGELAKKSADNFSGMFSIISIK